MSFINDIEKIEKLKDIECFVLDMDGTFNLGYKLIDGAMDFYNAVINSGRRILFLTNNSSRSGEYYVKKMNKLGCPVNSDDIFTSGMATHIYLNREYQDKRVYLLGNEFLKEEFINAGIMVVDENPDMVVVGYDTTIDYEKMCDVCEYVRKGLPYIATHPDYNCPTETGFIPDIGAIMAFIHASTGRWADTIVGKPYGEIAQSLMEKTQLPKDKILICGDRLYTDVKTGVDFGLLAVCVLSGESTMADVETSEVVPDLVFDKIADMIEYI